MIEDFNRIGDRIPLLGNLKPHGKYHMSDLDAIGGLPVSLLPHALFIGQRNFFGAFYKQKSGALRCAGSDEGAAGGRSAPRSLPHNHWAHGGTEPQLHATPC